jgi:hypothetical protein
MELDVIGERVMSIDFTKVNKIAPLVLVVRLKTTTYMKGNSLCFSTTITPLKRKSTLCMDDVFQDISVDYITNLGDCVDGVYMVESSCSYVCFGNVDDVEFFLEPYENNST